MELIIVLLIFALTLAGSSKKKKQQGKAAKGLSQTAAKVVAEKVEAVVASPAAKLREAETQAALERARSRARLRAAAAKLQRQAGMPGQPAAPTVRPAEPQYGQGQSQTDEEGCLGGSLEHDHVEGERREEHARHMAAMEAREREEAPAARAGIDARQLRRAVVMAEVLDRPKALRMRRGA